MPAPFPQDALSSTNAPDLMADGCVGDENGNLVFISGRATPPSRNSIRLTLGRDEQGLDQFHVITEQGAASRSSSATSRTWKSAARAYRARCSAR